jgi:peptidoglycan/xylan/chitin deacetylase (PgdA/CDA1 family)
MNRNDMFVRLISLLCLMQVNMIAQSPLRRMALTFDDLPYSSNVRDAWLDNAKRGTTQILEVLNRYRAPAIGFVVETNLQGSAVVAEGRIALLQQWLDAGMTLGNHTYSHPDFNTLPVEQFQEEILKGEVVTRRLMAAQKKELRYFRHPMTRTGDTQEKKEAIEKFLATRGYRVTPHTIENSDFIFTLPYSRAVQRGDEAEAQRIRAAYLDHTVAATAFAEKIAPQIFGREIPQTLLLHANDINADCLEELLQRLIARGYQFVTLDEAMADPAYQTKDTLVSAKGPTWLWRWMRSLGQNLSFADDPEPPGWVLDLYNSSAASGRSLDRR